MFQAIRNNILEFEENIYTLEEYEDKAKRWDELREQAWNAYNNEDITEDEHNVLVDLLDDISDTYFNTQKQEESTTYVYVVEHEYDSSFLKIFSTEEKAREYCIEHGFMYSWGRMPVDEED